MSAEDIRNEIARLRSDMNTMRYSIVERVRANPNSTPDDIEGSQAVSEMLIYFSSRLSSILENTR